MIETYAYLAVLIGALLCLGFIDYRYKLALFFNRRQAATVLAVGVLIFLVWDIVGIGLGIFYIGETNYITGLLVAPEVPVEEVFFLLLLNYTALLLWRGGLKVWPRT